ncbi:MAG: M20/M25/M40 family metallo-hydrolase [Armatimonadota bacterium]|nr:M20/M25/M40 family metallo-hydrolase [Armatimonadota bacterium]MDR7486442.1 M20/M25/M40 family metallo-hydrolase [Armatimonadota bacterium]MDR7532208.1 M20/M25/M40 family metallo-hydrolase [Armatimonadota bacterium]MDR7537217.1 M20/M25/M40 family metallo-hydrolase [Armatimonadota bacterium]
MERDAGTWRTTVDEAHLVAFLLEALAYPSPQTDLLETDPQIAAFIHDVVVPPVRALSPDLLHVDRMGNVLAQWGTGRPALAILVYAMTHPQTVMADAFAPAVVDGAPYGVTGAVVRGRGACEQKGAMAAALAAARVVLPSPLQRPFALAALTAGETGRPDAVRHLLNETGTTFEMAVVACGTGNAVCLGQKGRLDVDIVVRGRQSHSSMPWLGLNALEGAATVLTRLARHTVVGDHPTLGPITLTPTAIASAPRATHTVPETVRITVDRRLRPGEDPQAALAHLREVVGEISPFAITYEPGPYMYAYERLADDRLPRLLREAYVRVLGRDPGYVYASGGLDAGYLNASGIEAVMFGPGDWARAHSADDVVGVSECVDAAAVLAYAIARACGAPV